MSVNCLFCKFIRGEIPTQKFFENESVLGFVDIHPQAQTHLLFIHKNHTSNIIEMTETPEAITQVFQAITAYAQTNELSKKGFRIVNNTGNQAGQTVFHTHFHVLGGEQLRTFGS